MGRRTLFARQGAKADASEQANMTPTEYIRIAALVFVVLLFPLGYLKGCSDEKEEFDAFKAQVEAAGRAQEKRTKEIIAENKTAKEKADAENRATHAALDAERLRKQRTRTIFLPATASGPASPTSASFDRANLEQALQRLDAGVQGLVDEGDAAIVDLNTAKRWAQTGGVQ